MSHELDFVIKNRRSTRTFQKEIPPKPLIEDILLAGLYAPYSGLTGKKLEETRKFIIIQNNTPEFNELYALINKEIKRKAKVFNLLIKIVPKLKKEGQPFNKRIQHMANHGISSLEKAPYYVIIAEKKGIPASANLSIAHAMENMWLKATDLNLSFQVLSLTKIMMKNKCFMKKINLPVGKYEIDGCLIGYGTQELKPKKNLSLTGYVDWI